MARPHRSETGISITTSGGREMHQAIREGSGSRGHTTEETARRFALMRVGAKPKNPTEARFIVEDLADRKRTLAKLESDGLRTTRGAPADAPPDTWY